jgi:hypothetical protein
VAVISVCCTAKQPPNGPATALLRHRIVQIFPVDAIRKLELKFRTWNELYIPPVQARFDGIATVILKSSVLAWERPLTPGTLFVTVRFCEMMPALPVL